MSKKKKKSGIELKIKNKALELYEAGVSMLIIQRKCGSKVTVAKIRQWGADKTRQKGEWHPQPEIEIITPKRYKKNKKTQQSKKSWKKRVFAGWKDTPEQAAFRRSPAYQQWRIIVLERDKYTCQHCETTGGRLVVHHVKTFKIYPELRLEPDNGIVLCNDCHEKLHLSRVKRPRILRLA